MEAPSTNTPNSPIQSPLLLLNNMSNLMSTKLDSTNYMVWKFQISAILDAYSNDRPHRWIYSTTKIVLGL
jgi:hypothetical protein